MALIVKNAIKDMIKGKANISADFYGALDSEVKGVVTRALTRAKANNRKTIQARDL